MDNQNNLEFNNPYDKEKKKNSKGFLFIIVILLVTLITLFVYYLFFIDNVKDKGNDNQKGEIVEIEDSDTSKGDFKEEGNAETIDLDINSTIVKTLSERVIGVFTNNYASDYIDYFYQKDKIVLENESMSFKLSLVGEGIPKSFHSIPGNCIDGTCTQISYIDEDTIKKAYYEIFGVNSNYTRSEFNIGGCADTYHWSDSNNRYEAIVKDGCGGTVCGGSTSKLAYAKQIVTSEMDKIELYEYYYKSVCSSSDNNIYYYSDYNQTKLITKSPNLINPFNNFIDQLGMYKYTFIKNKNDIYVFTSVERVK